MKFYVPVLVCILGLLHGRALAVADSIQYIYFKGDNGLPSKNAYSCRPDRLGYIWMTTDNGIVKYNGHTLKVFNAYTGLPANDFYDVYEDRYAPGKMWLYGVTAHVGYFENDRYHEIAGPAILGKKIGPRSITPAANGKNFILTSGEKPALLLADIRIRAICYLRPGYEYRVNNNGLLYCYRQDKTALSVFDLHRPLAAPRNLDVTAYNSFREIFPSSLTTEFWIDSLLYCIKDGRYIGRMNFAKGTYIYRDIASYGTATNEYIYTYNESKTKGVEILTNKNLYILDEDLNLFQKENFPPDIFHSAQVAFFTSDDKGNKWYATTAEGVICKLPYANFIEQVKCTYDLKNSRFAVSNADGMSYWWNNTTNKIYQADLNGQAREWTFQGLGRAQLITPFNDSTVWLSFLQAFRVMNTYTGRVKTMTEDSFFRHFINAEGNVTEGPDTALAQLASDICGGKSMAWDEEEQKLIIQNPNSVLQVFYRENGLLRKKSIADGQCRHMVYSRQLHKYIFYGFDELYLYDPVTDSCVNFTGAQLFQPELKRLVSVKTDRYENIYFLCAEKLLIFNTRTLRWYTINSGFNLTYASVEVLDNRIAILGNFGVAAAIISGPGSIGPFHISCNAQGHYYNRVNSSWTDGTRYVMAETDQEWIRVNIDELLKHGAPAGRNGINSFSVVMNDPEPRKLADGDSMIIAPGVNKLTLDAINLYGNGDLHYLYKTDDGAWQQSASGEILLDERPPQEYYTLQLKIKDDSWQGNVITLYLYNAPWWWQTGRWKAIFWISGVIAVLILIALTIYITSYVIRRANEKKRVLTDLELRAIHAQINPHFIFNTLSTALYFISRKEFDNAYGHVNKFSHLLRSYLKSSHDRYILLSEEIDMLKRYADLQMTRFEEKFDFSLNIENKIPVSNIQIPSLLLQPLVENAINHGLLHKQGRGLLQISFKQGQNSEELICIIDDNGVGREKSMQIQRENISDRESYGNRLTQKLMDLFRRYEAMDIEIQYIDKTAPETGTIVILTIRNIKYIV